MTASNLIPEVEAMLRAMDEHAGRLIPALQRLSEEDNRTQSSALAMGLALRLAQFALGPVGAMHPEHVAALGNAYLEFANDVREDLLRDKELSN